MITYVFGKTGSGKSYKAVTLILEELKTRPVFSNIEFTKFVAGYTFLDRDKMGDWLSFIEDLYNLSQENLTSEEEIYISLRDKGIADCAIFIDEAHIYGFNNTKKKDFLMFFLALQRHVNLNIFLITQTRKQLNTLFHDLGDVVITAMSPTERLRAKVLEYRYFSHVDDIKIGKNAFKTESVKPKKEVFDYYTSGESNLGDGGFRAKLKYYLIGLFIIFLFTLNGFVSLFSKPDKDLNIEEPDEVSKIELKDKSKNTFLKSTTYIKLNCSSLSCKNNEHHINILVDDLNATVTQTNSKFLTFKSYSENYAVVTVMATTEFIHLFQGANNEKDNRYDRTTHTNTNK